MKKLLIFALLAVLSLVGYLGSQTDLFKSKYQSTTIIQVPSPQIFVSVNRPGKSESVGNFLGENLLESEFENILSEQNLTKMIRDADLQARWSLSPEESVDRARRMSKTKARRGTDFIEISARSIDREEARLISQGIADVYVARRNATAKNRARPCELLTRNSKGKTRS